MRAGMAVTRGAAGVYRGRGRGVQRRATAHYPVATGEFFCGPCTNDPRAPIPYPIVPISVPVTRAGRQAPDAHGPRVLGVAAGRGPFLPWPRASDASSVYAGRKSNPDRKIAKNNFPNSHYQSLLSLPDQRNSHKSNEFSLPIAVLTTRSMNSHYQSLFSLLEYQINEFSLPVAVLDFSLPDQ